MISMGSSISRADATGDPGVAGCLLQFPDEPEKLFVVTASHVLVATSARQFDRVVAKDLPGQTLGLLFGWTDLNKGLTTTDAALVQVDPALVSPELGPLGAPKGTNLDPRVGARLSIFAGGQVRSGLIREIGFDRTVEVVGPDFTATRTYVNQIRCDNFSVPGCSGAMAMDDDGNIVGMVVAGDGSTFTLVTPIDAVLANPDFTESGKGRPLEVQATIPPTAKTFPRSGPAPGDPGTELGRAQAALAFFQSRGWSRAQAIGIIANIHAESSFNPQVHPGDGGVSFGLCQWNGKRLTNFIDHVGHDITNSTFNEQLDFIDFELHTKDQEKPAGDLLKLTTNPAAAAGVVCRKYERPKNPDKDAPEREEIARFFDQNGAFPSQV